LNQLKLFPNRWSVRKDRTKNQRMGLLVSVASRRPGDSRRDSCDNPNAIGASLAYVSLKTEMDLEERAIHCYCDEPFDRLRRRLGRVPRDR
jgi:hypothetical protein